LPEDVETCVIQGGRYPVWQFARAVDRLRPDLVFTTLRMNATAAAAYFLQRHRPPLIARPANAIALAFAELRSKTFVKHRIAELLSNRLLRVPRMLVAQSTDMAEELARIVGSGQNIRVIGNPISVDDTEAACSAQQASGESQVKGGPSLVAVGRLAHQKGFDLLLPAFARFLLEYPRATLTIFGEGPDRAVLEQQTQALGITHAVAMPGQSDRILADIAAADIFVSSSRYEGFSNALLEAMALGRAIVATNCEGATKDLVIDGQTGILVARIDASALTDGLLRAMTLDRDLIGQNARNHVRRQSSRERIVHVYGDLFRDVLQRSSEPKSS
jgi:glycosyltransferase involved in cell wall biosynthesis